MEGLSGSGGSLWCGVLGTKSGIWPVAVFGPLKPFFGMLGPVPLADCLT